jgi:hypothetical protein
VKDTPNGQSLPELILVMRHGRMTRAKCPGDLLELPMLLDQKERVDKTNGHPS